VALLLVAPRVGVNTAVLTVARQVLSEGIGAANPVN